MNINNINDRLLEKQSGFLKSIICVTSEVEKYGQYIELLEN